LVVEHEEVISVTQLLFMGRRENFHLPSQGKGINVVGPVVASTTH